MLGNVPDWLRAAIRTALQTAVGMFALSLLGFLMNLQDALSTGGEYPAPSVLGKAAATAAVAAAAGVVSAIVNKFGKKPAQYPAQP